MTTLTENRNVRKCQGSFFILVDKLTKRFK